ncbi:hypothetical protein BUALT_Bualt02G0115900 [Buddleja alternifolia]|uniref:TATA element modulatory factor 1 TATA binding domain-containing protein n=1 Tax=Buddleja alternifolia TaxID=168488 RepID=A0AAV6Y0R5_9LAMI|nr:hypothetical protein BUALT_Bualt02G0115900 [Buddleja alternifolia]
MAWFSGKVSLGNFPDLAGAVNKLSESVKNIEKNFDNALGIEEESDDTASNSEASGLWPSAMDRKTLFERSMGFMGQKDGESTVESLEKSPVKDKQVEDDNLANQASEQIPHGVEATKELKHVDIEAGSGEEIKDTSREPKDNSSADNIEDEVVSHSIPVAVSEQKPEEVEQTESANSTRKEETSEEKLLTPMKSVQPESSNNLQEEERSEETFLDSVQPESKSPVGQVEVITSVPKIDDATSLPESIDDLNAEKEDFKEVFSSQALDASPEGPAESRESSASDIPHKTSDADDDSTGNLPIIQHNDVVALEAPSDIVICMSDTISKSVELKEHFDEDSNVKEQHLSAGSNSSDIADSVAEVKKLKKEMKMMETALQGAARQAQAKADEIAKLMKENEQLQDVIDDLRKKTNEAEIESLREEYHQRVAALERKVYALTKERDTLRREQSRKSDAAALLKEKDEIITQVMAEGEELSKKQAVQESQIRKLRAQIRELEEENKGSLTKLQAVFILQLNNERFRYWNSFVFFCSLLLLFPIFGVLSSYLSFLLELMWILMCDCQVEENKVESIMKDKTATEKLLQETVEKHQAELATQKEYYTDALNAAKEAEALAEARANTEARTELESRLGEAEDRESMLVQTLEELRHTLSRKEQQAVFREDMLRKDIEDLQKRYQASERRCEELIAQVPDSTRPLLRQIEGMQETAARRAEAWAAVERSLNSRLQEAEAKAAAAEDKERSITERLTQTLSRINVLEAQISCLRAEQTQVTKSLEKERQRAAENRQEYLALKEEADTHESRVSQLEEEMREVRRKHKEELHEALTHQELLQQELEREKAARLDQERTARLQFAALPDQSPISRQKLATFENGNLARKISSASSLSSMEESYFLQTSLDPSENLSERRSAAGEITMSPHYMKSMTSSTFEAALRQKEGELASYTSRLASMESIRDSLAEELVKMTAQCEKLQAEAGALPGIRAELEGLRRRHSAALELMGERDEELEELRADIIDLKEMYREQVNLLVNKIQILSQSIGVTS